MLALRSRSFFAAAVALGYVAFAALQSRERIADPAWIILALLFVAIAIVWIKSTPPTHGIDPIEPTVRSAARITAAGTAMLIASWVGEPGVAVLNTTGSVGIALATIGSLVSLARIAPSSGLMQPPPSTRRFIAAALASTLWSIAIVLPLARVLAPESTTRIDPITIDYANLAASTGTIGLIIAMSFRVRTLRRLELGVADRAAAALSLSVVALAVAIPASLLRVAAPDRVMAAAAIVAAACVQFACISLEPSSVARTMRTALGIVLLGAPVALAGVALSLRVPQSTGLLILIVGGASIGVGLAAPMLARPLAPARSRWINAIQRANEAALHPDPDIALRDALSTVQALLPGDSASPAVFQASPPQILLIDRAGYVHVHKGEAPTLLHEIAENEPERAVRTEVLHALEVRRPDLRPLAQWMDARGLVSVSLVRDEDGPVGLLGIPRGKRRTPMNLEEVRAIRVLADRIGAVLGVSSALARSRKRELEIQLTAEQRNDQIEKLQFLIAAEDGRSSASVQRLASPLRAKTYSPAATIALQEAKRLGCLGIPLTLLTPPGTNPIPWAAEAHLASARSARPFVIVYGTNSKDHELESWRNPDTSPLSQADTGTLMIVDTPALPKSVQDYIAASLAERIAPSGSATALDVTLMVSVHATIDTLAAAGRITTAIADWLGDRALPIPSLASRPEDLRAMVLDQLAHHGIRLRGIPLGIDDRALVVLMEHKWPGNDVELDDVLLRAALVAEGKTVTREDLLTIGYGTRPIAHTEPQIDEWERHASECAIPKPRRRKK
ncbi:MAG: hypothetical protein FWD57_06315 [Polyangiaceae bacterium]|nr:hypothetical protein [Polyangiaceae bacterium]